jgi:hypothetical protein
MGLKPAAKEILVITHLAIHRPKLEYKEDVLAAMRRVDVAAVGQEGLIRITGWREVDGDRLVGISMWEPIAAFSAASAAFFARRPGRSGGPVGRRTRRDDVPRVLSFSSTEFLEY